MRGFPQSLIHTLLIGLMLSGCAKRDESAEQQVAANNQPVSTPTSAASPGPSPTSVTNTPAPGFDVNQLPVVTPDLGEFPYFSLIEGYSRSERKGMDLERGKDAAFDRYEFFDGAKIIPVEGRLSTIEAEGKGAAPFEVLKTYERLVTGSGGVKVFEGQMADMKARGLKFGELRHRYPVSNNDRMGVYVLRTPESEIWVEAYVSTFLRRRDYYYLTVVEKQSQVIRASLLPAEEMKKELDSKGHVALYINFDFNKADVRPDSQPVINEVVKLLKTNPGLRLTVEGHTDNVGTPAYNKRLSESRAQSVVAALVAQGTEAKRLRAEGYGQEKPITDNSTDEGRAKNRRVELVKME